jgi:diguanylate cyclase (GGDEF)-like protein
VLWLLLVAALGATTALTTWRLIVLADARDAVVQALHVQTAENDLLSQMLNAETGQRGFLLSGRATYLQPYYSALADMREARKALSTALAGTSAAGPQLAALDAATDAKLKELDQTVRLKSEGRSDEAEALFSESGKRTMDAVREALRVMAVDADARTGRQRASLERELRTNDWALGAAVAFNLLLLGYMGQRIRLAAARGRIAGQALETRNSELVRLLEVAAQSTEQVHGLSGLSRFLQSCEDMDEAVRLLQHHLPPLLKAPSGALYLMAASRNQLSQAFGWGEQAYADHFEPTECWAVRLSQPFRQPEQAGAASCAHLEHEAPTVLKNIWCLPLMAHGELMGLLVLDAGVDRGEFVDVQNEGYRRIALEQVGLSLGNLKLRESLRQQSIRDALTGLYNRRFFEESTSRELRRATRKRGDGLGVALLMMDIDHFKRFNDEHGHEVGDQVLREVAQALLGQTRGSDIVARYGGEEFTVVLVDITPELALQRAEAIRADVEGLSLLVAGTAVGNVTLSIGVAQFPTHGKTMEALVLAADKALYAAKHAGRNRVVVAS